MFYLILCIIVLALVFDFLNGFHDAANSIATVVSTRVLSPSQAVIWAAFFNFVAAFVFRDFGVAKAISGDYLKADPGLGYVDIYVVMGGLIGAIFWNILTWLLSLPTSSSHCAGTISGLAGAAVAKNGFVVMHWKGWIPLVAFIVLSPLIGFFLGAFNMIAVSWIFRRSHSHKVDRLFRRLQLISAGVFSLGHGGNDAQKTMGIIVMLLVAAGHGPSSAHDWTHWGQINLPWVKHEYGMPIILACHAAIALGTLFGGWRIVKTMGSGITRLQPVGGFCAELAAATTIIGVTYGHIPISTTHAITGSILGVGTTRGVRSVRWIWGQRIVMAWVLTIPCAAFVSAITYFLIHLLIRPLFGG